MLKLTLDTNCIDHEELLRCAQAAGADVATFSVSRKETSGSSFAARLETMTVIAEQSVFADGLFTDNFWADRVWRSGANVTYRREDGDKVVGDPFEEVLAVISNRSFPSSGARRNLSAGQRRQFRDAMMLSLHAQHQRDVFISADEKAFVKDGRRDRLERMLSTKIVTPKEAIALLAL